MRLIIQGLMKEPIINGQGVSQVSAKQQVKIKPNCQMIFSQIAKYWLLSRLKYGTL